MAQRFNAELARERRYELGLTLAALAAKAGVSASHLSQIENQLYQPSPKTFAPIARALKISASKLWIDVEATKEGDAA